MARIKIEVQVPAGSDPDAARLIAKQRACEQVNLHIVEDSLAPVDSVLINNSSVDRLLTTWWDFNPPSSNAGQ